MSMPQSQLFETALSLPQSDRADLAFQLLQSLTPPGQEISSDEFSRELRERVESHRQGGCESYSLEETRAIIEQRLKGRNS